MLLGAARQCGAADRALFFYALRLNFSLRDVEGIAGVDAEHANCVKTELASRYRIPHVRFLVRTRAICLSGRGAGTSKGVVVVWLLCDAPLWVLVRVCGLLCNA